MPRRTPGLLLLLALAAPSGASAARTGDYSNLCRSQSGDLKGMTLTLSGSEADPSVALRVCEGVCWNARIQDVRLQGDRLTFSAEERVLNDHNDISKDMVYRFAAQLSPDAAALSANMVYGPQTLRWAPTPETAPSCR